MAKLQTQAIGLGVRAATAGGLEGHDSTVGTGATIAPRWGV